MKKRIKITSLLLVLVFIVGALAACGGTKKDDETKAAGSSENTETGSGALDKVKDSGKLRVGVFSDKPPFGYVDENGENQGYDIYLAKRLAKDLLGDESALEFVLVEAANRVEYLQSNKVDVILANFTVTDERKEVVDFASPYMKVALGVVSADGEVITDISQLEGKKLIVNKGTTAEAYFTKNYPEIELVKYDQNTEAFNALKDGRGDALSHDNTLVLAWAIENEGFTVGITSLGDLDYIAPAVQKGNEELLNWINDEIALLIEEGFFNDAFTATLYPVYKDSVEPSEVIIEK